jgi:tripartite-type tricarboxylate transporter receptor subunit TctC
MIRAGKLRALALTAPRRLAGTRTSRRSSSWTTGTRGDHLFSLGPAGMPPRSQRAQPRCAAPAGTELRERLRLDGTEPNDLDAAAFTEFVRAEVARWTPIVRASSARSD